MQRMMRGFDNRIVYALIVVLWLAVTLHMVIVPAPPYQPKSSSAEIAKFAKETLARVQDVSIAQNQEFCGVITETDEGQLEASQIYDGGRADCGFERLSRPGSHTIASFHTHGGTDPDYDSEFPSLEDVAGDMDERIAGYIATPGGRIWQIDWRTGESRQLCGEACLEQDPGFDKAEREPVGTSYTFPQLKGRAGARDEDL